eukprot:4196654-Amphidinium_carterae.3
MAAPYATSLASHIRVLRVSSLAKLRWGMCRGGGEVTKPWSKTGAGGQPTAGQLLAFAKQAHPEFSPAQLKTLIGQSKKVYQSLVNPLGRVERREVIAL